MKRTALLAITVGVIASASSLGWNVVQQKEGYTDTPFIFPGSKWRVHDANRPVPPVVTPAPGGAPVAAPSDAIILFDGKDLSKWTNQKWKIVGGAMMCREEGEKVVSVGDTQTVDTFEDFQLHAEWATPTPKGEKSQGRGNSGIFLSGKYEVQVLDSFGNPTYAADLAEAILQIISSKNWKSGIYNYSNTGNISWFDFATAIRDFSGSDKVVKPISTAEFPTPAKRPAYSVLDTSKIARDYSLQIKDWKERLKACLAKL